MPDIINISCKGIQKEPEPDPHLIDPDPYWNVSYSQHWVYLCIFPDGCNQKLSREWT